MAKPILLSQHTLSKENPEGIFVTMTDAEWNRVKVGDLLKYENVYSPHVHGLYTVKFIDYSANGEPLTLHVSLVGGTPTHLQRFIFHRGSSFEEGLIYLREGANEDIKPTKIRPFWEYLRLWKS